MSSMGPHIVGTRLIHHEQRCSSRLMALRRLSWTSQGDVRFGCSRASTTRSLSVCNDRKSCIAAQKQKRYLSKDKRRTWEHNKSSRLKLKVEEKNKRRNEVESDVILFLLRQTRCHIGSAACKSGKESGCVCSNGESGGYETCRVSRMR